MSDISDDEVIEKPKRVMSDKQKEALKKGRELAKANREAQKKSSDKQAEVKPVETTEVKPEKKSRKKKELVIEIPQVKTEVKNEVVKGTRISRKQKEVREPSPQRPPSPVEVVKKQRTPRQKKVEQSSQQPLLAQPKPQKPSLQFV